MAALCEEYTLCGLLSGTEDRRQRTHPGDGLQGVEEAAEPDTVLVTDGGRTVTVYKVSDQRPVGSWAVRQGQRITSPAVYNHSSGEFVVVHDEKVVRVWKDDDVSLDKVFKATLSADVCRVFSLPDDEPLVLFRGGALRYLDALLANPQQEIQTILEEDEKISWSRALSGGGQPLVIFITEKRPDWFVYTWRPAFSACQRWKLPPAADGSRLLDYSVAMRNNLVSLVLLYSSGHMRHAEVPLVASDQEGAPELLVSPLLQLPEAVDGGAVIILHDSYIATLTASPTGQKDRLCLWNTSFQTLQDHKDFSRKTWLQLWSDGRRLYIPCSGALLVLRFSCEASSLASALGKGRSAPGAVSIVNWEAMTTKSEPAIPAARRTPRARKAESSEEEARPGWETLQTAPEGQIPSLVQRIWGITEGARFQDAVCSATQRLVTRCQSQPTFYPQSALIKLIESGMLSHSLCPALLPLLLDRSDVRAARLCLQRFVDVPESVLCGCLKTFLSVDEDVLGGARSAASEPVTQNGCSSPVVEEDRAVARVVEAQGSPVSLSRAVLLNSVLTSPFSESFLLPHLKELSSEQVVLLLRYLHHLYQNRSESLALPGDERPSLTQVLDWMNLILDAKFTVLVLLPKAKKLLHSLQKYVRSQLLFSQELYQMGARLQELQKLRMSGSGRGRYCIEVLELY